MRKTEYKNSASLQVAIAVSLALVFLADALVPRGFAVWVLYLVPVMLCLFGWRPRTPVTVSGVATALTVVGFMIDVPGVTKTLSITNRTFGVLTMWTVALIGRQFLINKIAIDQQGWLRAGQNELSQKIQGGLQLSVLADRILTFLAEYIGAQTASLYIHEGDGEFRRYFSYCSDPDAPAARQTVRPGEGLVGQALKDRRILHVQDLPNDYLNFASTMRKFSLSHLVAAPAIADGEAEAVLEFGFVAPVDPLQIKFIEAVGESVGAAARTAKYRNRLEELLRETRRQAEELQSQSEELRVANEELEERSRVLNESQRLLESQQQELEETNAQLEEQTTALEYQKQELTQAQIKLKRHTDELEKASQYKSEFLANMSHELRTPLNSSLILAKLLAENKEGNLTSEQVKFAQTIHSAGSDLLSLINDVLDLSKIESGKLLMEAERLPLERLTDSLSRVFQPLAAEKRIAFQIALAEGVPHVITTDAQRLEQILKNLLSNAVKFTDAGSVTLKIEPAAGQGLRFVVIDTGIGIPAHQHEIIFEAFRQADGSTHRKYGGTGLGLSISRDLATLLGGRIEVESEPGKGSTFMLTIPVHAAAAPSSGVASSRKAACAAAGISRSPLTGGAVASEASDAAQPLVADDRAQVKKNGRTLLVVEDDKQFAEILVDLGHEEGFQCLAAGTASEALLLAQKHIPKAIVLDINLPDHSGLVVLDQLKRNPATRHIPVHVASVSDYTQAALELGAVSYALKPVRREELVATLRKVEARMDQPMRRILVVEDDDRQRDSICRLLRLPNVEIDAVATAAETLEHLKTSTYDCLVMDLGLQDMSGYELLDRMAAEEAYSLPPVIIYTGRALSAPDEQRLRPYSKSVIIKGARSPERLLDEVTLFLHEVESNLPPDQQRLLRSVRDRDAALEGRRILVVEDDVRNVFAITSILEPKGANVEIARTGREALTVLEKAEEMSRHVDLVLMDIMMPEMDGITAMKKIRQRPEWAKLPIVALTAKAMPDDREQCIQAGANDYISKPLDVDKLLSLVRVWIANPAA